MRHRPWPMIVLVVVFLILPFINITTAALIMKQDIGDYFLLFFKHATVRELVQTFLVHWLAAAAIFFSKKWTYGVFMIIMVWIFYYNYWLLLHAPKYFSVWMFIAINILNLLVMMYFVLPSVREIFLNKRLRWWEALPRYPTQLKAELEAGSLKTQGDILNISRGGVLLQTAQPWDSNSVVTLTFTAQERTIRVLSKVVYRRPAETAGMFFCGLQFEKRGFETRKSIWIVIRALRREGVLPRGYENDNRWNDFKQWLKTMFKTGKGIVPEIPGPPTKG